MMEMVVTTGAIRCANLQSNRHYRPDAFASPHQQCQSTDGRKYHTPQTCSPQAQLGSSNLVFVY